MDKPFSQACENNKGPILTVLQKELAQSQRVLEIGSGTGQHAVYFAAHLPHLIWQTSDQQEYHAGIQRWLDEAALVNLLPPLHVKIGETRLPRQDYDAVFTANTAHIMQRHEAKLMMQQIGERLPPGGVFCQYGPFTENGRYSSQSNQDFDESLVARGYGGYRDISELVRWADSLTLDQVITMPANNLLLVWRKP